jgi:hypothetical protein
MPIERPDTRDSSIVRLNRVDGFWRVQSIRPNAELALFVGDREIAAIVFIPFCCLFFLLGHRRFLFFFFLDFLFFCHGILAPLQWKVIVWGPIVAHKGLSPFFAAHSTSTRK